MCIIATVGFWRGYACLSTCVKMYGSGVWLAGSACTSCPAVPSSCVVAQNRLQLELWLEGWQCTGAARGSGPVQGVGAVHARRDGCDNAQLQLQLLHLARHAGGVLLAPAPLLAGTPRPRHRRSGPPHLGRAAQAYSQLPWRCLLLLQIHLLCHPRAQSVRSAPARPPLPPPRYIQVVCVLVAAQ